VKDERAVADARSRAHGMVAGVPEWHSRCEAGQNKSTSAKAFRSGGQAQWVLFPGLLLCSGLATATATPGQRRDGGVATTNPPWSGLAAETDVAAVLPLRRGPICDRRREPGNRWIWLTCGRLECYRRRRAGRANVSLVKRMLEGRRGAAG
jgi:hypothetical protein